MSRRYRRGGDRGAADRRAGGPGDAGASARHPSRLFVVRGADRLVLPGPSLAYLLPSAAAALIVARSLDRSSRWSAAVTCRAATLAVAARRRAGHWWRAAWRSLALPVWRWRRSLLVLAGRGCRASRCPPRWWPASRSRRRRGTTPRLARPRGRISSRVCARRTSRCFVGQRRRLFYLGERVGMISCEGFEAASAVELPRDSLASWRVMDASGSSAARANRRDHRARLFWLRVALWHHGRWIVAAP